MQGRLTTHYIRIHIYIKKMYRHMFLIWLFVKNYYSGGGLYWKG